MFKFYFCLVILSFVIITNGYKPEFTGKDWQANTAADKLDTLDNKCMANTKPYGWYSAVHTAEIFTESPNTTFDFVGDDMPGQGLFDAEERPKLIHTVGAIAECSYISKGNHAYTGFFKGCDNAFIRFSLAQAPDPKNSLIIPGISMKFLSTGQPSGNIFAMYSLLGQSSFNFFEHDLTNHAPDLNTSSIPLPQKMLYKTFQKASIYPTLLGISDLALYDQDGNVEANPSFPFRLVFHTTKTLHTMFPSSVQSGSEYYIPQLESIKAGQVVYEVYAQDNPMSDDLVNIGSVYLNTSPSGSYYGDKNLFFQHTRMEVDLSYYPSWETPTQQILQQQRAINTPQGYTYPDLPFN